MNLELREKVARLMGYTVAPCIDYEDYNPEYPMAIWRDGEPVHCGMPADWTLAKHIAAVPDTIPAYETNWGDAGQVIERMRELGFCFEMEYGPGPNSVCYARFIRTVPRGFGEVRCLPVATAICLAAVAAIEAEARDGKA